MISFLCSWWFTCLVNKNYQLVWVLVRLIIWICWKDDTWYRLLDLTVCFFNWNQGYRLKTYCIGEPKKMQGCRKNTVKDTQVFSKYIGIKRVLKVSMHYNKNIHMQFEALHLWSGWRENVMLYIGITLLCTWLIRIVIWSIMLATYSLTYSFHTLISITML